jgi:hypothetical protein
MEAKAQSVFRAYGLPDASVAPAVGATRAHLRAAVVDVLGGSLSDRDSELLAAWLSAFSHHWPRAFARVLGEEGAALCERCTAKDANRHLKLRRIAVENLSHLF